MKIKVSTFCLLTAAFMLSACDTTPKTETVNPLAGQVKALEKAKDVERKLLDAAQKQRNSIDDMTK